MPFDLTGKADPLEAKVEARAVKTARAEGWKAFKMGLWSAGWPDRLFLKAAIYVWIEFKRRGKQPTKLQLKRHAELRREGAFVYVCDTWQEAIDRLRSHDRRNYYPGAEDL